MVSCLCSPNSHQGQSDERGTTAPGVPLSDCKSWAAESRTAAADNTRSSDEARLGLLTGGISIDRNATPPIVGDEQDRRRSWPADRGGGLRRLRRGIRLASSATP